MNILSTNELYYICANSCICHTNLQEWPANYRGIMVTPVILKILEHILNERHNNFFYKTVSKLYKGFTAGNSSMVAALILSKCLYESKNAKSTLYVTTLDAHKTFHVVNQELLLIKLYLDGIRDNDWLLLQNLCNKITFL